MQATKGPRRIGLRNSALDQASRFYISDPIGRRGVGGIVLALNEHVAVKGNEDFPFRTGTDALVKQLIENQIRRRVLDP